jgi:RNA polymerase sigma-70 factor (ECF subfamily)
MFRATYDRVLAYALRRASVADAEDVVAESYTTAWRRFDDVPADPLPWLYAVARHTLSNARRSGRRRIQLLSRLEFEHDPPSTTQPDPSERLEDAALVRAAMGALSETDREALMLVAWEGLDNVRASAALGVSTQAFAVRVHRARRRLEAEIVRLSEAPTRDLSREDR